MRARLPGLPERELSSGVPAQHHPDGRRTSRGVDAAAGRIRQALSSFDERDCFRAAAPTGQPPPNEAMQELPEIPARPLRVVLTGTDPVDPRGGIGVALAGYRAALAHAGLLYATIPSYRPVGIGASWLPAGRALPRIVRTVRELKRAGACPVVYAHAGRWLSLFRESVLLAAARSAGANTVLQLHSSSVDRMLDSNFGRALLFFCLRNADLVAVVTPWWRERLLRAGVRGPVVVVPNSVPRHTPPPSPRSASEGGEVVVLAMTRLVRDKGVDVVIEALTRLPTRVRCVVAGTGPERPWLERLARAHHVLGRVTFVGWVSGDAKRKLLEGSDLFCVPSRAESFGMGYLDAMAHGLPVVAVRLPPVAEVVLDGVTGLLVEHPTVDAVASAIGELLDYERRRKMGAAGAKRAGEEFSPEAVGRCLTNAFASAFDTSGSGER
jgi:glycosyltransferase involved in cell wall biosynthesis